MDEVPAKRRRSVRLAGYDYGRAGAYFVTICTAQRLCTLGDITDGTMIFSPLGEVVATAWTEITKHYPRVALDEFVVMPNHLHGMLVLEEIETLPNGRGTIYRAPTAERRFSTNQPGALSDVIGKFKAAVTRTAKRDGLTTQPVWQRNYFEHVVRNDDDLNRIRVYIQANPAQWTQDELFAASP